MDLIELTLEYFLGTRRLIASAKGALTNPAIIIHRNLLFERYILRNPAPGPIIIRRNTANVPTLLHTSVVPIGVRGRKRVNPPMYVIGLQAKSDGRNTSTSAAPKKNPNNNTFAQAARRVARRLTLH